MEISRLVIFLLCLFLYFDMYGGRQKSHDQARSCVCAGCGMKLTKSSPMTAALAEVVKEEVYSGYKHDDTYFPNGLCGTCRTNLFKAKKGDVVPIPVRDRWNSMNYDAFRPPSRSAPCSCKVCNLVRHSDDNLEQKAKPDLPRKPDDDEKKA